MTIKTVIFRCKLEVGLADEAALLALMQRVGEAIAAVSPGALIDPKVEIGSAVDVNAALGGAAHADGYRHDIIKGVHRYWWMPNDGTPDVELTKEQYDAAHATPEMQAQLACAQRVSDAQQAALKGVH